MRCGTLFASSASGSVMEAREGEVNGVKQGRTMVASVKPSGAGSG